MDSTPEHTGELGKHYLNFIGEDTAEKMEWLKKMQSWKADTLNFSSVL